MDFYPRSPCGERPYGRINDISRLIFLSTLSLRRATPWKWPPKKGIYISIHALLAESDAATGQIKPGSGTISIHALLAESDLATILGAITLSSFLSTLSLRRATEGAADTGVTARFLSTLSLRRATYSTTLKCRPAYHFYPRSPCGERPQALLSWMSTKKFLSTLSLRRATKRPLRQSSRPANFYPRSPCGERRVPGPAGQHGFNFYPRSPCGERPSRTENEGPSF